MAGRQETLLERSASVLPGPAATGPGRQVFTSDPNGSDFSVDDCSGLGRAEDPKKVVLTRFERVYVGLALLMHPRGRNSSETRVLTTKGKRSCRPRSCGGRMWPLRFP